MPNVRGPFLEYECTRCGTTVQEKVSTRIHSLQRRLEELRRPKPVKAICACCYSGIDDPAPDPNP